MTGKEQTHPSRAACQGLPLEQALAVCRSMGWTPQVIFTGEREMSPQFTPRVIAVREDALIAACFRDGEPRQPDGEEQA